MSVLEDCPHCGKKRYPTRPDARDAAQTLYPGKRMRAYQCRGFWHLTSFRPAREDQQELSPTQERRHRRQRAEARRDLREVDAP